jgi:hypothetical protein
MTRKYLKSFKYSCHRSRTLYSDDTSWIENTWNHLNIHVKWFQVFSSHDVSSLYRVLPLWHEYLNDFRYFLFMMYHHCTEFYSYDMKCLVHKLFMVTSPFHSSLAIFQQYQHMELIFHNSYVILGLVPSKVILLFERIEGEIMNRQSRHTGSIQCKTLNIDNNKKHSTVN